MRFLLDENVPLPSVEVLVTAGHDVASVSRETPGIPDSAVLARAAAEARLIVTFDRDFGELVFARGASGWPGVIYVRFAPRSPVEPAELLLALLARQDVTLIGHFTVVDRDHLRQRRLPDVSRGT